MPAVPITPPLASGKRGLVDASHHRQRDNGHQPLPSSHHQPTGDNDLSMPAAPITLPLANGRQLLLLLVDGNT